MPDERGRLTVEEETTHARRGACFAIFVVPILCVLACGPVLLYTEGGQMLTGYVVLSAVYPGLPVPIPYVGGIQSVARRGCDLDRQNPRPGDYQAQQDALKAEYGTLVGYYNRYWIQLNEGGWDISSFEPAGEIPGDFNVGKATYCRQQ